MIDLFHPAQYQRGLRVLYLRGRRKDGNIEGRDIARVSHNEESFRAAADELTTLMKPGERIYASVGARSIRPAMRIFRERQLASEFDGTNSVHFYKDLNRQWASCLMQEECQNEKKWLFDCDTPMETKAVEEALARFGLQSYSYNTPSGGKHIITDTFDLSRVSVSECDGTAIILSSSLKRNPLMLWNYHG